MSGQQRLNVRVAGIVMAMAVSVLAHSAAVAEVLNQASELKAGSRMQAYLTSPSQLEAMTKVVRFWEQNLDFPACDRDAEIIPQSLFVFEPIELSLIHTHPIRGKWQHRFVFQGCGRRKVYNAVFAAREGKEPRTIVSIPGTTIASPELVRDAMRHAHFAVWQKREPPPQDKPCIIYFPADTWVSAGSPADGQWQETWLMHGCGGDVEVTGTFTPDGNGGTYIEFR